MGDSEEDKKDKELLEEGKMTEKEITKARFKYFFVLVSIFLVIALISAILLILFDKDLPLNRNDWKVSYQKAQEFVSKLNHEEKVSLLYGTENMRFLHSDKREEKELEHLCVGQIDPIKNDKIDFKGMCLQDGPAGVRFVKGTSIS